MVAQQGDTTGGSETWQNSLARICSLLRRFFSGNTLSVFGKTRLLWRQWIIYRHAILIIAHFVSCRHKIGVYFCSRVNWSYFLSHLRLLFHIIRTYCAATSSTRIDKVALPKVEIIRKKYSLIFAGSVFSSSTIYKVVISRRYKFSPFMAKRIAGFSRNYEQIDRFRFLWSTRLSQILAGSWQENRKMSWVRVTGKSCRCWHWWIVKSLSEYSTAKWRIHVLFWMCSCACRNRIVTTDSDCLLPRFKIVATHPQANFQIRLSRILINSTCFFFSNRLFINVNFLIHRGRDRV